jgi:hypothetical protein
MHLVGYFHNHIEIVIAVVGRDKSVLFNDVVNPKIIWRRRQTNEGVEKCWNNNDSRKLRNLENDLSHGGQGPSQKRTRVSGLRS